MFRTVEADVIAGVLLFIITGLFVAIARWFRNMRKLVAWSANQMANDGNGTWRAAIDRRLTALENATPGVFAKPDPITKPPLDK